MERTRMVWSVPLTPWRAGGKRGYSATPVTILVLQLWPSILVPCPSLEPGSLVMALPCDGETVFG